MSSLVTIGIVIVEIKLSDLVRTKCHVIEMSRDQKIMSCDRNVMWLYEKEQIKISYDLTKFYSHSGSEDIMIL